MIKELFFGRKVALEVDRAEPITTDDVATSFGTIADNVKVRSPKPNQLPSHRENEKHHAQFMDVAGWKLPALFPFPRDTHPRQAVDREVLFVRNAVGVSDLSALGCFEIGEKDAVKSVAKMLGLKTSDLVKDKITHSYLIDEDGIVISDVTVMIGAHGAVEIVSPIETADVTRTFLTSHIPSIMRNCDQARIAVNGPMATELLKNYLNIELNNNNLPQMAVMTTKLSRHHLRVQRVSFTGENGYELIVDSKFGPQIYGELTEHAQALGGGLYGYEARNVLRIEAGHLSHREMDGRMCADDLGIMNEGRDHLQLVGIRPCGAVQKLLAGALMFGVDEAPIGGENQGHVSSVCYSPTIGKMIGMAFVKNGRARLGEKIRAVDLVRDFDTLCEIVDLDFLADKRS